VDFRLSDEEVAVRDTVRDFVNREVMPYEQVLLERDGNGQSPDLTLEERDALRERAKSMGLWGIDTPEEYGGVAFSSVIQALINIELGRTFVHFSFGGSAPEVLYLGTAEQKERYLLPTIAGDASFCFCLSEPGIGSDAHGLRATAVRDGDEWVINGEKTWITFGNEATFALVFCRTTDDEGQEGVTAFLVDRDMGWKSSPIRMMGSHDPASISFQDVRVPHENIFGEINKGFAFAMKFIYRNRAIILPGRQIGGAERLLGMAIEHARNRVTFGEPLADRENIRWMIAESDIDIRAAKLLMINSAWDLDSGKDVRQAACATKYFGANAANRIVDRVLQIHGGMGYSKEMPIERWYRDFRVERIYEGSDEMNLMSISRNLFKGHSTIGDIF
jgi:acyl-CoA dehydrogenase